MNRTASTARADILARIRSAVAEAPDTAPPGRTYLPAHVETGLTDLLAENLAEYRAIVHRCSEEDVPGIIAALLSEHGDSSAAIPTGLPDAWLGGAAGIELISDSPALSARDLETVDAVISGCALAIAETGTLVLDAGPGQGRRILTLVPDHHICIVRCPDQVVASVPQALALLDATRPQTWIAGPSATSDIELDRVEGVHGPRLLDVLLVAAPRPTS